VRVGSVPVVLAVADRVLPRVTTGHPSSARADLQPVPERAANLRRDGGRRPRQVPSRVLVTEGDPEPQVDGRGLVLLAQVPVVDGPEALLGWRRLLPGHVRPGDVEAAALDGTDRDGRHLHRLRAVRRPVPLRARPLERVERPLVGRPGPRRAEGGLELALELRPHALRPGEAHGPDRQRWIALEVGPHADAPTAAARKLAPSVVPPASLSRADLLGLVTVHLQRETEHAVLSVPALPTVRSARLGRPNADAARHQ